MLTEETNKELKTDSTNPETEIANEENVWIMSSYGINAPYVGFYRTTWSTISTPELISHWPRTPRSREPLRNRNAGASL